MQPALSLKYVATSAYNGVTGKRPLWKAVFPVRSRATTSRPSSPTFCRLALSQCPVPRHHLVTARSLWPLRARGPSCRRHFVDLIPLTLFWCQLKTFLSLPALAFLPFRFFYFFHFQSHAVRCPCCVSRGYVAVILTFLMIDGLYANSSAYFHSNRPFERDWCSLDGMSQWFSGNTLACAKVEPVLQTVSVFSRNSLQYAWTAQWLQCLGWLSLPPSEGQ